MIQALRHIALGGSTRDLRGMERVGAHLARTVAFITVLVFFADTINADILYAAIKGDVRFQDNPLIIDSATDSTSVIPDAVRPHTNYFALAKFDGGANTVKRHITPVFHGTTILEDVDSPTVLDGATTASLTFSVRYYCSELNVSSESAVTTLDRTITYGCLLI